MKALLILLLLVLTLPANAQKVETPCQQLQRILKDANKSEADSNFTVALRQLNAAQVAARNCGPGREEKVKEKIVALFVKIEKLREQANVAAREAKKQEAIAKRQTALAQKSAEEAQVATNNATALYWASEADKINPIQGLRLLEVAENKTKDEKALNFIREQTQKDFQWEYHSPVQRENRYEDYGTASSPFRRRGLAHYQAFRMREYQVWESKPAKCSDFLQGQKDI